MDYASCVPSKHYKIMHNQILIMYNPSRMGLTKCTPNEFVPSIIVDGLLMEKNLGVLNFFVLILQIPTYLGTRGVLFFYTSFFNILMPVSTNSFSESVR